MQLSVIILNYNVRYFLEQCVRSVQKALENIDAEIIVVDNNSTDDSCLMMKQLFPQITLIENKENLGFPKGNNIAVEQAKGEYICILNPDTVVAEDTFKKLLAKSCQPSAGITGCKLIDGTEIFFQKVNVEFQHLGWLLLKFLVYIKFLIFLENIMRSIYLKINLEKWIF